SDDRERSSERDGDRAVAGCAPTNKDGMVTVLTSSGRIRRAAGWRREGQQGNRMTRRARTKLRSRGRPVVVDDLGVDDLAVGSPSRRGVRSARAVSGLLVDALRERQQRRPQPVGGVRDGTAIVAARHGLLEIRQRTLDLVLLVTGDLVALLPEQLLGLVDERLGLVADLRLLTPAAVVVGMRLGVPDHLVDVVLGQRRLAGDR